jgi:actin related protein 2/3 complex subunit 5
MTDTAFRKIDVDQYDEDVLVEGELYEADPRDPQTVLNDTKAKNQQVRSALSKFVAPVAIT